MFRSTGVVLLALILITLTSNLALSTFQSIDATKYYYWLKPGVFFKYELSTNSTIPEDQPPTQPIEFAHHDPSNILVCLKKYLEGGRTETIIRFVTRKLYITWTVLDIVDHFIIVEYRFEVPYGWIYHRENNSYTRFVFNKSYTYIVDLETLDTYTYENNRVGRWVGEWPYLLKPEATTKKSMKLVSLHMVSGKYYLLLIDKTTPREELDALLRFAEYVNQTVYRLSNGTKIYTGGFEEDTLNFNVAGLLAYFVFLSPPPYSREYRFGNIVVTPDRIVYANVTALIQADSEEPHWSFIPEDYLESFNELYNNSKRPLLFLETPAVTVLYGGTDRIYSKWMVMIDPDGDVYAIFSIGREVLYDAVTGVLLKFTYRDGTELMGIPRFKNHAIGEEVLTLSSLYGIASRGRFLELRLMLVDTNIGFERPVFGLTPAETPVEAPSHDQFGLYNTLVIAVSIAIPLLAITYLYLRRVKRIQRV